MSNFPIENTYNGYNVTNNYYSTGGSDGSLNTLVQQSLGNVSQCLAPGGANLLNAPFWQSLMATQQNLFSGWNGFGGCPTPQPQPQPQQPGRPCGETRGRCRVDITIHRDFYQSGCGGPFTCGGSATSTNQTHSAFGSRAGCSNWANTYGTFGYGNSAPYPGGSGYQGTYGGAGGAYQGTYGGAGCGYQGTYGAGGSGYQGSYGTGYGGYQGSYGGAGCGYQGSYGSSGGGYQSGYGSGYGSYQGFYGGAGGGYQSGYGSGYGSYQGSYGSAGGGYQSGYGNSFGGNCAPLPSFNSLADFTACYGGNNNAFGVMPSAYPQYAMTSPFTDFGTAAGIAAIGGALSLLF